MYKEAVKIVRRQLLAKGVNPEDYTIRVLMKDHVLQNQHYVMNTSLDDNMVYDLYYDGIFETWELRVYKMTEHRFIKDH